MAAENATCGHEISFNEMVADLARQNRKRELERREREERLGFPFQEWLDALDTHHKRGSSKSSWFQWV